MEGIHGPGESLWIFLLQAARPWANHAMFLSIRMIINKMVIVVLPDYLTGQSLGTNEALSKSVFLNIHS